MLETGFGGTWYSTLFGSPFADFLKGNGLEWGTWPTTAPLCPIFVAMVFFIKMWTTHIEMTQIGSVGGEV